MISYNDLEQFGFSENEAKVYLAALSLGAGSVQNIAKKAGIHRVTTYDIIKGIIQKGFISETYRGKKRQFAALEPKEFLDELRSKEKVFADFLPELKALQGKGAKKPKVMYFEGAEALKRAYFDRIRHTPGLKENLVYGSSAKVLKTLGNDYRRFTKERIEKGIKARIIVEKSESGLVEAKRAEEELREVKFLPHDAHLKTNTIIYGDRVMIVSWENLFLTIIEDADYAESQRAVFELLWKTLP